MLLEIPVLPRRGESEDWPMVLRTGGYGDEPRRGFVSASGYPVPSAGDVGFFPGQAA